MQPRTREH